jgi:hypothetical protein
VLGCYIILCCQRGRCDMFVQNCCRPPQDNPKTLNTQLCIQLYQKKLARFQQFAALYPECYWVFIGDNGQVGLLLLRTSAACPETCTRPPAQFPPYTAITDLQTQPLKISSPELVLVIKSAVSCLRSCQGSRRRGVGHR